MVSLEQIRALEARVEKAVGLIDKLRRENADLEQKLIEVSSSEEQMRANYSELEKRAETAELRVVSAEERATTMEQKALEIEAEIEAYKERALSAEHRSAELEAKAEELKKDQARIEEGLTHALNKLDAFEDLVMGRAGTEQSAPAGLPNEMQSAEPIAHHDTEQVVLSAGDEKVEAVEESLSTPVPQATPFPGAENELDIF